MLLIKSNTICAILDALSRLNIVQRDQLQTNHYLERFAWDLIELLPEFQRAPGYHHIREATWLKHLYCFVAMYKVDRGLSDMIGVTTELLMAYSEMLSTTDTDNDKHTPRHLLELDALLVEAAKFPRLPAPKESSKESSWDFRLVRESVNHARSWEGSYLPEGISRQDWVGTTAIGRAVDGSILYPELMISLERERGFHHIVGRVDHVLNDSPIRRSRPRNF